MPDERATADDEQTVHELGLQFVQQHILTFGNGPCAGAGLHRRRRLLLPRHRISPPRRLLPSGALRASCRPVRDARAPNAAGLPLLRGRRVVDVDYDTALLGRDEGMLLTTVYGQLVGPVGQQRGKLRAAQTGGTGSDLAIRQGEGTGAAAGGAAPDGGQGYVVDARREG
ncbi:hypothetical protein C8J57DRAFT_1530738 [Mycena rebaudengoi]|nr:hypothetical protein C8J57DRAFT_1530738 [Mycena rebaudengoi]